MPCLVARVLDHDLMMCPGSFFCRQPGNPSLKNPWLTLTWIWQAIPISFESNTHYLHWVSRQPPLLGLYSVMFSTYLWISAINGIGDPVFQTSNILLNLWMEDADHVCQWWPKRLLWNCFFFISMFSWISRNGRQESGGVDTRIKIHCCG